MIARRNTTLAAVVALALTACSPGSDSESVVEQGVQDVVAGDEPGDAVVTEISEPEPTTAATQAPSTAPTSVPSADPTQPDPATPAPGEPVPGMFADDQTTELAVSILVSQTGLGNGQSRPISFAVGLANREVEFEGSPFEYRVEGTISAPLGFNDEGDLTEDPDKLRAGIDEILEAPFTDLFVGAVPPAFVAETTELAVERGIPIVLVNHVDDGSVPQLGVRLDLAGPADLSYRALVEAVVDAESDGVVVVGSANESETGLVEQLLTEAGAAPEIIDASDGPPSPSALIDARERIGRAGERPSVVLLSQPWASPLMATMAPTRSSPSFYSSDRTLSRADVAAIDDFGGGRLTMVRRVDDARRPEQADFVDRLFFDRPTGATVFAAESYDAYALAAIAAAAAGFADSATIRAGMIDASRMGEPCSVLADCLTLAANGVDVDYDGQSGPIDLDDDGVATAAWFSIDVVDPATGGDASSRFAQQRT